MDSHIIRKAAARLPALADLAVLRFNFRGVHLAARHVARASSATASTSGTTSRPPWTFVAQRGLPHPWLLGWSFGTEVVLKYGLEHPIAGAILLSPPLHRATRCRAGRVGGQRHAARGAHPRARRLPAPGRGRERFAVVPDAELVAVEGGKHLWVGEKQTRRVLSEIVGTRQPGSASAAHRMESDPAS